MNTETVKVLGKILQLSQDASMRQVLTNLMDFDGELTRLDTSVLFAVALSDGQNKDERKSDAPETGEEEQVRDMRIRWMTFSNLRSIPHVADKQKPFGLSFSDDNKQPCSLYLVGRNGTGKTTVYSALEHHYLSSNSLSKNMDLDARRIMTYGFGEIERTAPDEPWLTVETVSEKTEMETLDSHAALCSPACFCSEYDILQMGTKGKDLFDYLLQQLGYQELKDLLSQLDRVVKDIDGQLEGKLKDETDELDSQDYDAIVLEVLKRYKNAKQLYPQPYIRALYDRHLNKFNNGEIPGIFVDYWNRFRQRSQRAGQKVDPARQLANTEVKPIDRANAISGKLRSMYQVLEPHLKQLAIDSSEIQLQNVLNQLYEERKSVKGEQEDKLVTAEAREEAETRRSLLMSLMSLIREQRRMVADDFINAHFDMLKRIMSFFSNNDAELLKPRLSGETLKIQLLAKGEGESVFRPTPQEYYNSFRYKLYAVSFKIALAFMEMGSKHIRVPIVIDDVFSASDFENNLRLEYFVYNIYEAYDNMNFEEPLQLILLTHDEMVQTAFRKGTDQLADDEKPHQVKLNRHNFVCGRLYSYKFAEDLEKETGTADLFPFYNLYIRN